jgi:hypothetical protein
MVATATIKVPLNLAADTASVAKLDLLKFVPFGRTGWLQRSALIVNRRS